MPGTYRCPAETGLYYLQSRYYDPAIGRFINADEIDFLGSEGTFASYNLFAYCGNNPVNRVDDSGQLGNWIIGGLIGGLVGGITSALKGESFWAGAAQGAVTGAIAGAAVDIAVDSIATFGVAGVAAAGVVAFAGGFLGNIAGEETYSLATTGSLKEVDNGMISRSAVAGVVNIASMGFSAGLGSSPQFAFQETDVVSAFGSTHFSIHSAVFAYIIAGDS